MNNIITTKHGQPTIDDEFKSLIPPIDGAELSQLQENIRRDGCREPIAVWHDGDKCIIVDGHNRSEICKRYGITHITTPIDLEDRAAAIRWIILNQFGRRNLNAYQRADLALKLAPVLAEDAKSSQGKRTDLVPNSAQCSVGKTDERLGKIAGVGKDTIQKARAINKAADDETKVALRKGETTINAEHKKIQKAKQAKKRNDTKRKALKTKSAGAPDDADLRIIHGDCLKELGKLDAGCARLIFADPPYNCGIDYGAGETADRLDDDDYLAWCESWMQECCRVLADDGSMWVLIDDRWAGHFDIILQRVGLHRRSWIIWYESFGQNLRNGFSRTHRHIHHFVKDPKRIVFNADAVNRPSDRQVKYGDKRANPDGRIWDDVWDIPRVTGTSAERMPDCPTQLPLALLRPIIGCASAPGDLVVDPFSGSGTTGCVCKELGRRYIGIETQEAFVELSRQRIKSHGR